MILTGGLNKGLKFVCTTGQEKEIENFMKRSQSYSQSGVYWV
jgi:hypothetical protein